MNNAHHHIRKVLIANRGEIACRIARTCRSMGIASTAVYSDADADALHPGAADEAVHIGGSPASDSYLNMNAIIAAAQRVGADAIHPGFGFLAENPRFAQAVIDAGLIFIGPPVSAIEAMGKKRESKLMLKGIPLVPGYSGADQTDAAFASAAQEIGFPIMVKASAGGGGKGMRRVDDPADLPDALAAARREAQQAFGDDTLILEKLILNPRHVEVQILGDQHGTVIALGERECSIQRRHQKIVEETPSTALTPDLRQQMCAAAVSIGQQLGYTSAGTVEFLVDADKNFYFMEMNTRLQVEHPVTEMVYDADLVRWQIAIAQGASLAESDLPQRQPKGHAIEVRVYAEDPANDFLPVTGRVLRWDTRALADVPGIRVDAGIQSGDTVSVYYDPMLAKIIAWGADRAEAIRRLDHALAHTQLLGLKSNLGFLRRVLLHPDHLAGNISTQFLDQHPDLLADDITVPPVALIAAALSQQRLLSGGTGHWRNNPNRPIRHTFSAGDARHTVLIAPHNTDHFTIEIGDESHTVRLLSENDGVMTVVINGHRQQAAAICANNAWWVHTTGRTFSFDWLTPLPVPSREQAAEGSLRAPMPGQVISIRVESGQAVVKGDILLTMEAMKMEHRIQAPYDGVVGMIHYQVGDSVQADAVLLELNKQES